MAIESTNLELFKFIRKISAVSEVEIAKLALKARASSFHKGEIFLREGEICERLLFIKKGLFRYYLLDKGKDVTKDFAVDMQNPFCTGYTSFILQQPSQIWIESLEDSSVLIWNRSDILPLFNEHHEWLQFSKKIVEHLFIRKERREVEWLKCSAKERYDHFLADFPGLSQRVSQYHIASYLGIAPESLSRIRRSNRKP